MNSTHHDQKGLTIAPLGLENIEWARQLRNHPDTRRYLGNTDEVSAWQQQEWFNNLQESTTQARYVAYLGEKLFGIIRLDFIDKQNNSICIGMDIHPDFRGEGLSFRTYNLLLEVLFKEKGYHRVWLYVGAYNPRAVHIYTKLGFKEEGRQREALLRDEVYWDSIMMSILRSEYESSE